MYRIARLGRRKRRVRRLSLVVMAFGVALAPFGCSSTEPPAPPTDASPDAKDPNDATEPLDASDATSPDPSDAADATDTSAPDASDGSDASDGGGKVVWRDAAPSRDGACAIRDDGALFCWGAAPRGGAPSFTWSPRSRVGTDTDWVEIKVGRNFACARKNSGTVHCWGSNADGRLGRDTMVGDPRTPAPVGTDTDWAKLSLGIDHACAIKTSGALYCWGSNVGGRLGIGSFLPFAQAPRRVGTDADWADLAAGGGHTCARKTSGQLFCWGPRPVGDGTTGAQQVGLQKTISPNATISTTPTPVVENKPVPAPIVLEYGEQFNVEQQAVVETTTRKVKSFFDEIE